MTRTWLVTVLLIASAPACKKAEPDRAEQTADIPPKPPEHAHPTSEALARKTRSETRLKTEGVKVSATLPVIATETEAKIRTKDEMADRTIALMLTAVKGEGLEQERVDRYRKSLAADALLSPEETRFVTDLHPSDADRAKFAWRYECLGVLLWALGFDVELGKPVKVIDAGHIVKLVVDKGPAGLRAEAKLRSAKELLDAADLLYRYDWACVDARLAGTKAAGGIDCEIVIEQHRALNWLIGYNGQAWDDVSTDT